MKVPELTFEGVRGQPDFAQLYITFYPGEKVIELKSLKEYCFPVTIHCSLDDIPPLGLHTITIRNLVGSYAAIMSSYTTLTILSYEYT